MVVDNSQFFVGRPTFPAQLDMSHPLTRGLVRCWVLNEDAGMRAWDSSPYMGYGTVAGGARGSWQGRYLDAVDDDIACGTSATLDLTTAFTILAWVKSPNGTTGLRTIFSKLNAGVTVGYALAMGQVADGELQFLNTLAWVRSNYLINDGNWHLVGVTYDSVNYVFYNNGVAVQTTAGAAPPAATGEASFIGQYGGSNRW